MTTTAFPLDRVLLCAICEIEVFGWTSGKEAYGNPRVDSSDRYIAEMLTESDRGKQHQEQLVETAKEKGIDLFDSKFKQEVRDIKNWFDQMAKDHGLCVNVTGDPTLTPSSWLVNVWNVYHTEYVTPQKVGLIASLVSIYRDSGSRENKHLGDKHGERLNNIKVIVTNIKQGESDSIRGKRLWTLVSALTSDGYRVKWFAKNPDQLPMGTDVSIVRATITKHEEWHGIKSTMLSNVVIS